MGNATIGAATLPYKPQKAISLISLRPNLMAFLVTCLVTSMLHAGAPENLLLLVNSNSQDSVTIANHYIQLRNIPPENVVYLDNVPETLTCSSEQFRESILLPALKEIEGRKLGTQIEYVVYSAGFPTTITIDEHVKALKEKLPEFNDRIWVPRASINALTYHFQEFLGNSPSYLAMDANWYARRIVRNMLEAPFAGKLQSEFQAATDNYREGNYEAAAKVFSNLLKDHPQQIAVRYYLARALAREGKTDEALKELDLCVRSLWCYRDLMKNDKAFDEINNHPRFLRMIETVPDVVYGQLPTRGFRSDIVWGRNGWQNGDRSEGKQFVLSTVLAVTAGRGNTVDQAIENLKRSKAADSQMPDGTFFFSRNGDVRSTTRQGQFPNAMRELRSMGFRAEMIPEKLPRNRDRVLGATLGSPQLDWTATGSRFEPGALADNLTSFGGILKENASQTPLTHFIAEGAAGASGTVVEPLAIPNKFPDANLHVHYAKGCTLAEAYYQAVQSPFQLLIVGDPLCAPWANVPKFEVLGLKPGQEVTSDLSLAFRTLPDSPPIRSFEIYLDGKKGKQALRPDRKVKIGLKGLSDGYHEIRIVGTENSLIGSQASEVIGFSVNTGGKYVNLDAVGSGKYQYDRTLTLEADTNAGERIEIFQNSRLIGAIEGSRGELTLDCSVLGRGPSRLRAVVSAGNQKISSKPIEIEITP